MDTMRIELIQDKKGMVWDLLMYVPTVTALFGLSAMYWFKEEYNVAYLLLFPGCYFLYAGINRIMVTRMMIWPSAPVAIEVEKDKVGFMLRNGKRVEILKELRYYPDYSGKTFGLSGMDGTGKRLQFVLHKGQFADDKLYQAAQKALRDR